MSIYEYNEEYVKKVLYEDGMAEGIIEGSAAMVAATRKMHSKGFSSEEIADLFDQERTVVEDILKLATENPEADNLAIARMLVKTKQKKDLGNRNNL